MGTLPSWGWGLLTVSYLLAIQVVVTATRERGVPFSRVLGWLMAESSVLLPSPSPWQM